MSKKNGKKLGKFALWVFVIMIIAFVISASIVAANIEYFREKGIFTGSFGEIGRSEHAENIDDEEYTDAAGVEKININVVSADVNIIKYEGTEIRIHFHGTIYRSNNVEIPRLLVETNRNVLNITVERIKKRFGWFTYFNENTKLDIYVPEDYNEDFDIDVVSSDVSITNQDIDKLKVKTVSGIIELKNTTYNGINADCVSGDIYINGEISDSDLDTVSGDINLTVSKLKDDVKMNTISGDVNLSIDKESDGFKIEYSTVSGDLQNTLIGLEIREKDKDSFLGVYGNEKHSITFNSVSGDISIR